MIVISSKGLEFIKSWEDCKLEAYLDEAEVWTIGWGSIFIESKSGTEQRIREGDKITQEQANSMLFREIKGLSSKIDIILRHMDLAQAEQDALISLAYNIGFQAFKSSTLVTKLINQENDNELRNWWLCWNKITKDGKLKVSVGLTRRRKAEWRIFNEGKYENNR